MRFFILRREMMAFKLCITHTYIISSYPKNIVYEKCSESPNGMPQSTLLMNKAKDNNIQL